MEQREIDRLVHDIQNYLHDVEHQKPTDAADSTGEEQLRAEEAGLFIPNRSRKRLDLFMKYSRLASYAIEVLTISLFMTGVLAPPFNSWPATLMFLLGVLAFGIFTITMLLGLQARVHLLLQIESNTQRVALNKRRIAEALERIRID